MSPFPPAVLEVPTACSRLVLSFGRSCVPRVARGAAATACLDIDVHPGHTAVPSPRPLLR